MEQEFDVEIKEVLSRVQKVKAESLDDAINKAMDMYYAEQIVLGAEDMKGGLRIADRRKEMGLSQDELAHRAGIGRQALSAIENGGDFKTQTLDSLAIVLGVSVDFIMYGEKEEKSELLSEAMDVLSDMDELQIRQCLAMMKAMKSVSVEK